MPAILIGDSRPPGVEHGALGAGADVGIGAYVLAMPQGADMPNLAEHTGSHHFIGMSVEHAVVALMTDREKLARAIRRLDHALALSDIPAHELFAQDMLALLHGLDRRCRMQMQRQ